MIGFPFSVCQSYAQIAAVTVASPASTFFRSGDLPMPPVKCLACKRVKFDCAAPKKNGMFKAMMVGGESAYRPNKGEDGGFDWRGKFCPSGDYLGQVRTRRD
ncbi:MAG: hypothetical protein ACLQUR_11530 [Limisphaerales bacterium]|jgi:hypothetical protein